MDSRSECHGTARQVFRVCASNLASDESLGYRHMRDVYHQGRILNASTKESHGGDLIIQRGAQLPKSKVSVRKEVDSKEYQSVVEADLPIAKKGTQM
ncbi:hypothetical protein GW17_00049808 [Ensete ventricosum]|nr:hypothetical protein GW17_00049808 [Ensete ventricosum]RZR85913.1 hypothetical protein BHM03_00012975 [Ensete ventricosum]